MNIYSENRHEITNLKNQEPWTPEINSFVARNNKSSSKDT